MKRASRLLGLGMGLLALIAAGALAQDCVNYPDYIHYVGQSGACDNARDLVVDGDYAYVASWAGMGENSWFYVMDVSDPTTPAHVADIDLAGYARAIAKSGDTVYLCDGPGGLIIIDVATPAFPALVDTVPYAYAYDVEVTAGGLVAVTSNTSGGTFHLLDLSDPASPVTVGSVTTGFSCYDIELGDHLAYLANYSGGMAIVDLTTPGALTMPGTLSLDGNIYGVATVGDYCYAISSINGLHVVAVADSSAPALVTTVDLGDDYCYCVAAEGASLFVGQLGLTALSLADPASPAVVGGDRWSGNFGAQTLVVAGGHIYSAASGFGLVVTDIGTGTSPQPLGSVALPDTPNDAWNTQAVSVAVRGDHAYVGRSGWEPTAGDCYGLQAMDIADATAPSLEGYLELPAYPMDIVTAGDWAYVALQDSGLLAVSLADPANPARGVRLDLNGNDGRCLAFYDATTLVVGGYNRVYTVDIGTPGAPAILGSVVAAASYWIEDVAVQGDRAYVACDNDGMKIVNLANLGAPAVMGVIDIFSCPCNSVAVKGDYAFVHEDYDADELLVVNVSNPSLPGLTLRMPLPDGISGGHLYLSDDTLWYAASWSGVWLIDISTPALPAILGGAATLSSPRYAIPRGDYLYTADGNAGLTIMPRQCGQTPVALAAFSLEAGIGTVTVRWEMAAGSDPAAFRLTAARNGESWPVAHAERAPGLFEAVDDSPRLAAGGTVTYALESREAGGGWTLLRSQPVVLETAPARTRLAAAFPNPFNPHCTLRFELAAPQPARLAVHDVAGRLVAVLAEGDFAAGPHEFIWNGRDGAGREAAGGVYFARLTTARHAETMKLVLLR